MCPQAFVHPGLASNVNLPPCVQGFLQTALVVSSFHVLDIEAADEVVERTVRILYGEGDRYGCWLDVLADNIVWHELSDPAAVSTSQLGADMRMDDVSGCPHKCIILEESTIRFTVAAGGPNPPCKQT